MRVLPPSVSSLICFFLLATPTLANPVPAPGGAGAAVVAAATVNSPTAPRIAPRQATARMGRRKVKTAEPLQKKDYSAFLCPESAIACPVVPLDGEITAESISTLDAGLNTLADWFTVGFECVELASELNQCGGCLALGAGQDCSIIPNARATGCENSQCRVYSCFDGYVVSPDRGSCVKKGSTTPAVPVTAFSSEAQPEPPHHQHILAPNRTTR